MSHKMDNQQWWIQDFEKVGGMNYGCLLSLRTHIYIITKTTRWEVVKTSDSPKRPFFVFPHSSEHFHPNHRQPYIFLHILHIISFFNLFSLRPHPPLYQKGEGMLVHTYSYSYSFFCWDTPTSGPKGGA